MAKTAPNTFVPVSQGALYEGEPIIEGNATPKEGWEDMVLNTNHVRRSLTPTVVQQLTHERWGGSGLAYYSATGVGIGNKTLAAVYKLPTVQGHAAAPRYTVNICARGYTGGVGTSGIIELNTGAAGPINITVNIDTAPTLYGTGIAYGAGASEYLEVYVYMHAVTPLASISIYSISVSIDRGDNPVPDGLDVEPYQPDEPLAVYMARQLRDLDEDTLKDRMGVVTTWSAHIESVLNGGAGRQSYYYVENDTVTPIVRLPVRIGPLTTTLRVYVNGFGVAGHEVKFYVTYGATMDPNNAYDDLTFNTLMLPGAFTAATARTGFLTGTLSVKEKKHTSAAYLWMTIKAVGAGAANQTVVSGISVWEEPV